MVAVLGENVDRQLFHHDRLFRPGDRLGPHLRERLDRALEIAVGLDLEAVELDLVDVQSDGAAPSPRSSCRCVWPGWPKMNSMLTLIAQRLRVLDRLQRLPTVCGRFIIFRIAVVQRLHADRQPVHAEGPHDPQPLQPFRPDQRRRIDVVVELLALAHVEPLA